MTASGAGRAEDPRVTADPRVAGDRRVVVARSACPTPKTEPGAAQGLGASALASPSQARAPQKAGQSKARPRPDRANPPPPGLDVLVHRDHAGPALPAPGPRQQVTLRDMRPAARAPTPPMEVAMALGAS
ncbi:MAG: hypothetical protein ACRDX8_00980 [Acidimicrobiales bacterium]